ncbi:MAG: hypothetical protein Q4A00_07835 [Flavobacteriaceae bacterium]|nr:hypothetical protein [Flavobacteriaceae bacterium]
MKEFVKIIAIGYSFSVSAFGAYTIIKQLAPKSNLFEYIVAIPVSVLSAFFIARAVDEYVKKIRNGKEN